MIFPLHFRLEESVELLLFVHRGLAHLLTYPCFAVCAQRASSLTYLSVLLFLQSLCFLVRDWYHPHDHPYGMDGGDGYLERVLRVSLSYHNLHLLIVAFFAF